METDLFQWENSLYLWQFQSQTFSHDKRYTWWLSGCTLHGPSFAFSRSNFNALKQKGVSRGNLSRFCSNIVHSDFNVFRWIIVISSFLVNSTSPVICHTAIGYSLVMRERFGARVSIFPFYIRYEMGSLSELRTEFPNHLIVEDFFPLNGYP